MRIEPLGDLAFILRDLDAPPAAVARALTTAGVPGVTDVVPCAETVGVYFRGRVHTSDIATACTGADSIEIVPRALRVPVCYELGPDLDDVALGLGIAVQGLIDTHCGAEYACFAIGFCPGFAYLGPLPEALRGVPRLASPRVRTEPGSLGITGNQTAVYPLPRPGGWPIIGMTPLILVDEANDYFPIAVGDRIRFEPITMGEYARLKGQRL